MIVESMATSVVVGKVRGGKIKNIEKINLKAWYLFIIGFSIEFASVFIRMKDIGTIAEILDKYFIFVHALSYILIFVGLILNFKKKSMIVVFIGILLNFIVIMANGGHMPVSGDGLLSLGLQDYYEMLKSQSIITHTIITESTKLSILGDIIPLKQPYPFPKMISIGDVFLGVGIFVFIQEAMLNRNGSKT